MESGEHYKKLEIFLNFNSALMNFIYALISLGLFFVVSILFMYLTISGDLNYFLTQLKWFLRITTPLFIVFIFYLGKKDRQRKE